jgi:hypothetical protein
MLRGVVAETDSPVTFGGGMSVVLLYPRERNFPTEMANPFTVREGVVPGEP